MDREFIDRWCERGILGLVLAILVFAPLSFGAVQPGPFLIIQAITVGVLLLWLARLWISPRPQILWPPICWVVIAFVGYAIARYLTADIEYIARAELIHVLVYAFLFLAVLNNLHRQEYSQVVVFALLFVGVAEAFYAVYQFTTDSNRVLQMVTPYRHRGTGTYINPNNLGGFLEMLLPLALSYTLMGRIKPVTRVLTGYAGVVILVGLGITLSRGAWIAAAISLTVFFAVLLSKRSLRLPAAVLLLLLLGGTLYLAPRSMYFQKRMTQLSKETSTDNDSRVAIWHATARMWQDHFWWGVGPGHFNSRFPLYRPDLVRTQPGFAHNDYLNTLADYGIVGMSIVAAALVVFGYGIFRTWRHVQRAERELGTKMTNKFAFVLGASMGLLALLAHSYVDFNMHIPANAILALTLMALLSCYQRFATERYWSSLRVGYRAAMSLVLLAGVAWLGYQDWRGREELKWLTRASQQAWASPQQIAELKKAFEVEPMNPTNAFAIAEAYRIEGGEGNLSDYEGLTREAMNWYSRAMKLDPYSGYNYLFYGVCLDFLEKYAEAEPYYAHADELDPAGYRTANYIAIHYVSDGVRDYAAAKPWLERSLRLEWRTDPTARNYLRRVNDFLREGARQP